MSDPKDTRAQRLRALMLDYRESLRNHGSRLDDTEVAQALKTIQGRRSRVSAIESEIETLRREVKWLEDEIDGREAAVEVMLRSALDRWERMVLDTWSPTAVLGYRIWSIEIDGLRGARVMWPRRKLTAQCATTISAARVPHSDGRCGRLGCGIYATKRLGPLLTHVPRSGTRYVAGVTALTGKVVEHEDGYRAEHGELVAAVAVLARRFLATDDLDLIDDLCREPETTIRLHAEPLPSDVRAATESYLTRVAEGRSMWT